MSESSDSKEAQVLFFLVGLSFAFFSNIAGCILIGCMFIAESINAKERS
jgi:hypothetical protein